jgi:hypothetical protein
MKSRRLVLPLVTLALAACSTTPSEPELTGSDEAAIRALVGGELAGTIACGETKKVEHTGDPDYRALSVTVTKGQVLDVRVRAPGMDPRAWLTTPKGTALAKNDDESDTSKDSHFVYTAKVAGENRIVFRDRNYEDGTFEVTLACNGGPAPDAGAPSDAGAPPPPPPPPPPPVDAGPPVMNDPFDAASCTGAPMTLQEGIAMIGAGNQFSFVPGQTALLQRTRLCNAVTGCAAWSVPAQASQRVYMASGGDNATGTRAFSVHLGFMVGNTVTPAITAVLEEVSRRECAGCSPGGVHMDLGKVIDGEPTLYYSYPLWVHGSSGFYVESHGDSLVLGRNATNAFTVTNHCARLDVLSADFTTEYAVLIRY